MSFPRYPEYKDSGVAWLGQVPTHWQAKRTGYFFHERREKVSDKDFDALSVTKNGVVPQLETAAKTDDGDNRKKVCAGDFVINSRSDRKGSAGAADRDGSVSLISTVLRPRDEVEIKFAHHLLRSELFQEEFYRFGKGIVADLWSTNFTEMRNIVLAIPPLQEQRSIATFLDHETAKIDALVVEQEKLITLLQEKRQAVISHAVTKGLNPNVPMKDSGVEWLGEVPEHWEVKVLKFIATVQTGIAKGKDNTGKETITVPYLRVANVQDGYLALDDMAEIEISASDLQRYLLQPGDVLMNEGGDFDKLGRGHIWRGEIESCIHQNHVFAVRPHGVSSEWLNAITGSGYAQFYFMTRSKQSTNLASISSTSIMELPVLLPPRNEQAAVLTFIAKQTSQFDTLMTEARSAITLLQERRTALISAAVTGQIDVRTWTPQGAA
ncbi:type I restriction endonuclease subunit S [Comamonas jiangduensis]|uniref:Type I restriction endonuclease subunit S n=1 Tax=Comamonas jiangduensis TaxID=1194168 RepID=A0ABV4IKK9_9BURK